MTSPMKWIDVDVADRPAAVIGQVTEVCAIPASVQRVVELTRSDKSSNLLVVDAVSKDPALAAEVLRIANSPFFGQTRQVKDLGRAVVVLGMQELHNSAMAMFMLARFATDHDLSQELHSSSVVSATASRMLAQELGRIDQSTAFLSGLLAEIGAMACLSVDTEGYAEIWRLAKGSFETRAQLEKERYGATSEFIGAGMLARNQLPLDVIEAIGTSVESPPLERSLLAGITLFSRCLVPILVQAVQEEDIGAFEESVSDLASRLSFLQIETKKLVQISLNAGTAAELGLRGEVMLIEKDEKDGEEVGDMDVDIDFEVDNNDRPNPPQRSAYDKIRGFFSGESR